MESERRKIKDKEDEENCDGDFNLNSYLTLAGDRLHGTSAGSSTNTERHPNADAVLRRRGEASSQVPLRSTQLYAALDDALAQLIKERVIADALATHVRGVFDSVAPNLLVKADNFASGRDVYDRVTGPPASYSIETDRRKQAGQERGKKKPPILVTGKVENYSGLDNHWSISVKGAKITCTDSEGRVLSKRSVRELELRLSVSGAYCICGSILAHCFKTEERSMTNRCQYVIRYGIDVGIHFYWSCCRFGCHFEHR